MLAAIKQVLIYESSSAAAPIRYLGNFYYLIVQLVLWHDIIGDIGAVYL